MGCGRARPRDDSRSSSKRTGRSGRRRPDTTCSTAPFYVIRAAGVILERSATSCNRATAKLHGQPLQHVAQPLQYRQPVRTGLRSRERDIIQHGHQGNSPRSSQGLRLRRSMNGINSAGAHEPQRPSGERFMGRYHPMMENCPRQFQVGGILPAAGRRQRAAFLHVNLRHIDAAKACGISSTR